LRRLREFFIPSSLTFSDQAKPIAATYPCVGRTLRLIPLVATLLFAVGCEKKTDSIVDSVGHPPILLQAAITPSSINSDSINIGGSRSPDDLLSLSTTISARVTASSDNPILSVDFSVKSPSFNQFISDGELLDDGVGADRVKGDSLFTGRATFQIKRVEIGVFKLEISAKAQNGFQSNTAVAPLTVYRGNHPPTLSNLDAPDTLKLANESQLLTLRIKASDPDGLSDLARVIFNSYKPDGSASSGNPFQMYDDGSTAHGDLTAGDGTYSLIITLPSTTQTGTYRFEFRAFDRSNESSATVIHQVTVKQ
jgi:hypothetical protein